MSGGATAAMLKVAPKVLDEAIEPAMRVLPRSMNGVLARAHLLAIGLQESDLLYRRQLGSGIARGLWQFELGSSTKGGGVWGVYQHKASREHLIDLCAVRGIAPKPAAIYVALEKDDVFAAGVARLLLWTDSKPLPSTQVKAWEQYAHRLWRPGKPHPQKWPSCWAAALQTLQARGFLKLNEKGEISND